MTLALGLVLGIGSVLALSPFLWPLPAGPRRPRITTRLAALLAQAGMHSVPPAALLVMAGLAAAASAALVFALVPVVAIAVVAGLAGLAAPLLVVVWRARGRRLAARMLWPYAVDHLVSAVRSGLALPDSVVTLAQAGPAPAREAFAGFERDYRATGNFGLAVDRLKERLADPIADRILETLRMSREVGGSELTTVLRNLASYLRQEAAIRAEVEARQSWVTNAAKLGVAAPWIILVLLASRPEAAAAYNSPGGVTVIVGGLFVTVIAYRLMLAIGRIPGERRWFG
ncbi:MAG TPA: type II secretion system F family protein [Lacisediminihabitans sp.]|uniref:type II secretion system F family protein n=1 Tax=Lacisediminihabitans sp. TaxID=2787631 RepID=UPI002ED93465